MIRISKIDYDGSVEVMAGAIKSIDIDLSKPIAELSFTVTGTRDDFTCTIKAEHLEITKERTL